MRKFIEDNFGISDEMLLRIILEHGKMETVKRGELLISSGELQTALPILLSGIFRGFVLDEEGREVTDCFTSCPGVFVAGDCRTKKVRQVVTAMADGGVAGFNCCQYLDTL